MLIEHNEDCPSPSELEFPSRILIRIWPHKEERKYEVCIRTDYAEEDACPQKPTIILLNIDEVDELNKQLQSGVQSLSRKVTESGPHVAGYRRALEKLAESGKAAFNRIFIKGKLRDTIQSLLHTDATIQVVSEEFFLPWELLYDGPLDEEAKSSYFWGIQYIILRTQTGAIGSGDFATSILPSCPKVGLAAGRLRRVDMQERPKLNEFARQQRIGLFHLDALDPKKYREGLEIFDRFLRSEMHILHLACHAKKGELKDDNLMRVLNSFDITMRNFYAREFEVPHNPIVFFNACLTGMMSPSYATSWAILFCQRGARGVLATEFRVPDWFAASFILELYLRLLEGKTLGQALLATRRHFLHRHPLGLGYALYAIRPSITIAQ